MRNLNEQQQTAIEAVAKRFSATWEKGSDPVDAYLTIAGKRFAINIATLKQRGAKPQLRFDKVATRLIEHLQSIAADDLPRHGLLRLTAPRPSAPSKRRRLKKVLNSSHAARARPRCERHDLRKSCPASTHQTRTYTFAKIDRLRAQSRVRPSSPSRHDQ